MTIQFLSNFCVNNTFNSYLLGGGEINFYQEQEFLIVHVAFAIGGDYMKQLENKFLNDFPKKKCCPITLLPHEEETSFQQIATASHHPATSR